MFRIHHAILGAALALGLAALSPALAEDLPTLTVSGPGTEKTFSRDDLEKLGLVSVKTTTQWNEGVVDFEGVPMTKLLAEAGVSGTSATVTALNDYSVDIPASDFADFGVILAVKRNGAYMPPDDQGPFFVIYPFDSDPKLQRQPYVGRAVWQVKSISIE
jgi:hypothetical protein